MKKTLSLLVFVLISIQMLLAVPDGVYCDNNGKAKVLVQSNTIYCFDNDGKVRSTWQVVNEEANGRFSVKPVINGSPVGYANSDNAWWSENGKIYLNMANQPRTLTRK